MIISTHIDLGFKNQEEEFGIHITDISEFEHEIEVYTPYLHPSLKRGWVGDIIYFTHKAFDATSGKCVDDMVELLTIKDVLLRSVQCFTMSDDEPTEWKYTFLKD